MDRKDVGDCLRIQLFDGLRIHDGSRPIGANHLGGARPRQVLEILLAARGHRVPTERLSEFLWGPEAPENAAASIQTFISVLRRSLVRDRKRARELVVTERAGYRFATELIDLDLDRFDELLERASREPVWAARRTIEDALDLARGELFADDPFSDWAHDLRVEYRSRALDAHLEVAEIALSESDGTAALAHAAAAAGVDRFSERALRTEMLALYLLGRQHDALARYRAFSQLLDEELGLAPGPEARALESAILRQEDPQLLLPRPLAHPDAPRAPSAPLLGRRKELQTLAGAVARGLGGSFTLAQIEGEAGSGKSRLLGEVARELGGVRIGHVVCSQLEQHLSYVALAAALRAANVDPDPSLRETLGAILPELAHPLLRAGRTEEVAVLEALVQVVGSHAPLVLIFDDLHLADPATIGAIHYLQRRCTGLSGAIIVSLRTEHAPPFHTARSLQPDVHLELGPLSADELEVLGIPGLYESTGGSPRLVADLVAHGHDGGPSAALAESILDQCWQEGPRAYRILIAASLLDPPFEPGQVEAMLGLEVNGIVERLETLCRRRILQTDGVGFRFRYQLVREVLLDSLSPARLRLLQQRLEPLRLSDYR